MSCLAVFTQSGVRIRPGLMVLTRMFIGMNSVAMVFDSISSAALVTL